MKKKLCMLVSVCLLAMCLVACGETVDPTTVDYNGYTYENLQSGTQQMVQTLENYTDEQIDSYLSSTTEADDAITYNMISGWKAERADAGAFVKFGEFTPTATKDTLSLVQEVVYENKTLTVTAVYEADTMATQSVTIDPVYSLGEKMQKAGMNTLMGIGTVFLILILISLIIYSFRIISYLQNRAKKQPVEAKDRVVEQIVQREEQLQDDLELVAVISAAIAAATGSSTDDFVVRSIKRR